MALSPSLQQFKSSGVYRLEFDKSQIINIPAETIRLIIGFSKKGPFNTPVFVQDTTFFRTVFGDIDTTLERKGSFFHRTALTCLTRGPVIVLNLLNLTEADKSQFQVLSTSSTMNNLGATAAPVSSYFNTDKFWFPDANALVDYANDKFPSTKKLLNLANVSRKTISTITKKSDILGFDVLAKDWFSVGQIPEFMNENDYISDYLVDLIVVEGDFSDYTSLSIDPIFGPYFDAQGLKVTYTDQFGFTRDGLNAFLSLPNVNVLGVYTGALLPEFQDKNGANLYIEDLVNLETNKTGLLLGFDNDFLDDNADFISGDYIDLVGHGIESEEPVVIDFLSYYGPIIDEFNYSGSTGVYELIIAATAGLTAGTGANTLLIGSTAASGATAYVSGETFDTIVIYGPNSPQVTAGDFLSAFATSQDFANFRTDVSVGNTFINSKIVGPASGSVVNYSKVISESYSATNDTLTLQISLTVDSGVTGPTNSTTTSWLAIEEGGATVGSGATASLYLIKSLNQVFGDGTSLYTFVNSDLYQDNLNGIITDGDRIGLTGGTTPTAFGYVEFTRLSENNFSTTPIGTTCSGEGVFDNGPAPVLSTIVNYLKIDAFDNVDFTGSTAIDIQPSYRVNSLVGNINESLEVDSTLTPADPTTVVWLDNSSTGPLGEGGYNGKIKKGQYLVMNFGGTGGATSLSPITGKSRLTKIISVSEISDPTSTNYKKIKVTTNEPIFISNVGGVLEVERYKAITEFATHYRFSTLGGYTLTPAMMPDGTLNRQNEILDVMYDTGIYNALIDREVITYRYIVDTFEGGIEPASKIRLSRLAKAQQSSLAICNMPSVKQFRESTNPLFKFNSSSNFDAVYIADGGNLDLNPSNVFSLPGIADGANYSAFYGPYLNIRENGSNKSVPPAAHVSNLYIDKYNLALPYSIVAGPRRGVITGEGLVGVEYAFDRTDLDAIEPFGYNSILNKRGFGLVINSNQTAQQTVKSALSQIHVRELLIYIQDGIEAILKNYRWEFNTAQNRLEIKTLADNFLTQILSDGGVYDFQNIMDSSNNTPEIIDSNIGILDTYIEPVRGMGILIHRTTILKTGTIATGNFI
jgi:hypothetical protein